MTKLQLTEQEKEEILNIHLPYKITQLKTHVFYQHKFMSNMKFPDVVTKYNICAIEISFIAGRLFLEFLGLTMKNKQLAEKAERDYRADDITVQNFGCETVRLNELTVEERNILTIFFHRGNKGSGHFTWEKREVDGWQFLREGVYIIIRLLNEKFYAPLQIEMKEQ